MRGGKSKLDIMKKFIIFLIALLIIAAGVIATIFIVNSQDSEKVEESKKPPSTITIDDPAEKVKITFDCDGGNKVSPMTLVKGEPIDLPYTEKEGYALLGWYLDGKKIEDGFVFEQDATLVAKWEVKNAKVEKFTVSFDSKGGSKVSKVEVQCGKNLKLPKNPTKDGYMFVRWEDKNGQPIYDDAKLYCENITLYAVWEKNPEKAKEYTCPSGYKLNGTKCTISEEATMKCPNTTYEFKGSCVTYIYGARKDPSQGCDKTTVHTGGGHTEEVEGEFFKQGASYCYFKVVTTADEQNQSTCNSRGHKWNSSNNKCYYYRGDVGQYVINTCESTYVYITIEEGNKLRQNSNMAGCFPATSKYQACQDGWVLNGSTCTKTIDATLK